MQIANDGCEVLDLAFVCNRYLSQSPLLGRLLITLHLVAWFEVGPIVKAHAALGSLAHLHDVLFDVLEGVKGPWDHISIVQGNK